VGGGQKAKEKAEKNEAYGELEQDGGLAHTSGANQNNLHLFTSDKSSGA
jgi:hypothetical protein